MTARDFATLALLGTSAAVGICKLAEHRLDRISRSQISTTKPAAPFIEKRFSASSGNEISFRIGGATRPRRIYVLCHGLGTSSNYLMLLADRLSRNQNSLVVAYDRAGYRRSRVGSAYPYSVSESLCDLGELIGRLPKEFAGVVLVGHSFGAYIAHRFAEAYPEQVDHLWLIEPTHPREISAVELRREGTLSVSESIRMNTALAGLGLGVLNDSRPLASEVSGNRFSYPVESELYTGRVWRAMRREWDTISALLFDGSLSVSPSGVSTRVVASAQTNSSGANQRELFESYLERGESLDVIRGVNHHSILLSQEGVEAVVSLIDGASNEH
ncbi:alpha/beta hydrolase [Mycetocola lacteus]|uniref:Alpha/beta hydrolase n=1 Tax=Mycetocola lacteus TaxID=76637 RepID=A0A3L7ALH0_9MICO|nr:alpha/beta hydrolase [Mycetocola lacteus]RLP81333.1 alpha/beta hydrolase [Mycetocola lacteus]